MHLGFSVSRIKPPRYLALPFCFEKAFGGVGGGNGEGVQPLSSVLGYPAAPPVFRWSSCNKEKTCN